MSDIRWTTTQKAAIERIGSSVLVSAGAGSGKTAVLAERCAALIADGKRPGGVDRLLVVTFTEAAAAEMRARIGTALRGRLDKDPDQRQLRRQLALLDSANISTLHAFCRRLLNRFFAQAGIDPQTPILDPADAKIMRRESIRAVFDEFEGRQDDEGRAFLDFLDAYGGSSEESLMTLVQQLDDFLASVPDSDGWLREVEERHLANECGLMRFWLDRFHQSVLREIDLQRVVLAEQIRRVSVWPTSASSSLECLQEYAAALDGWFNSLGMAATGIEMDRVCVEGLGKFKFPSPPRRTKKIDELPDEEKRAFVEAAELVRTVRDELFRRDLLSRFGRFTVSDLSEGINQARPHLKTFLALVHAYRSRYQLAKSELAVMDFSDLERNTLRLLKDETNGVASRLRDQFDYVLVDEFQDINPVQAEILRLVSREAEANRPWNLFTVGDVKQSIYRFRLAEPRLFLERQSAFRAPQGDGSPEGTAIDLSENFRSRPILLDAINSLFERLMTSELGGIDYDEATRLKAGRVEEDFRTTSSPPIEMHIFDDVTKSESHEDTADSEQDSGAAELFRIEREAFLCADRIRACLSQGYQYSDIVILMRSMQARAGLFIRTLSRLGIPVFSDTSGGLFESLEAQDILSLLAVMDNARQDIPIAAILRSPLFGEPLTDSELAEFRADSKDAFSVISFHESVWEYASHGARSELRDRLRSIRARIDAWRQSARRRPLADVLWEIYEQTGYLSYVSGLRDGPQRRANLIRLHEYARQFGSFRRQGLLRFLQFIDGVRAMGDDLEPGAVSPGAEDVVRVMTIHRSKGLEFPVVVVAELGKRFNLSDARGSILFDRELGVGIEAVDLKRRIRYETLPHRMVADAVKSQSLAEELRVLYVAMTRAKEKLILVGTKGLAKVAAWRERLQEHVGPLALNDRMSASCALDWVGQALACTPEAWQSDQAPPDSSHYFVQCYDAETMKTWALDPPERTDSVARLDLCARFGPIKAPPADAGSNALVSLIERRITTTYPLSLLTRIPAVAAASVLKRRWNAQQDAEEPLAKLPGSVISSTSYMSTEVRLRMPRFTSSSNSIDQTERGTWTHEFLQRIDLSRPCDEPDLIDQRQTMVNSGILLTEEASQIDMGAIAWFFTTDFGLRMRSNSTTILREWPFVIGIDPVRFDPRSRKSDVQDMMLVRGVVDCIIKSGDNWEILDYKTDRVSGPELNARAAAYAGQLQIYAHAVDVSWGRRVSGLHLAFLGPREIVQVPLG